MKMTENLQSIVVVKCSPKYNKGLDILAMKNYSSDFYKAEFPRKPSKRQINQKFAMDVLNIAKLGKIKGSINQQEKTKETFHQLMKNYLIIAQCFSVMPVKGIKNSSANALKFSYYHFVTIYSFLVAGASLIMALINLYWVIIRNIKFDDMSPFIWYSSNMFVLMSYLSLAKRWPALMQNWEYIENNVSIVNPKYHLEMKRLIRLATFGIPTLALIEHLLSIAHGLQNARKCRNVSSLLEAYFKISFPGYYSNFEYNVVSGVLLQILNLFCTFIWNFNDNFIIIVSLGLTAQFKHFNAYFDQFKGKPMGNDFWGQQREYYTVLADLLLKVDAHFSVITMVSFSNNLYYICLQLFNSVAPSDTPIRAIYFWFSLFYLIGRTLLVSLSAARIHDETKKPAIVLRLIPSEVYLVEAKRFMELVINSRLALSGMNFFHITRKFILKVAGTVVTYELVLIQLQREPDVNQDPCIR